MEINPNQPTKIMFVDDEEGVLNSCRRLFSMESYDVVTASTPEEALEIIPKDRFAVVVSDYRMPRMVGTEFLSRVRNISPDTIRIILTGYADLQASIEAINRGAVFRFLTKPWNDEDLKAAIQDGVSLFNLIEEKVRLDELTKKQNQELGEWAQTLESRVEERTREVVNLNVQMEKGLLATIDLLADIAETHSAVLASHARRVKELSIKVGKELGMTGKDLLDLEMAATLHDIGKISISTEILKKTESQQSIFEKEAIQKHVTHGESMLRSMAGFDKIRKTILHHHESCDGRGYPAGLKKDAIPLASRIIAVANAFDHALNARADYHNSSRQKAMKELERRCPHDLDPWLVGILNTCLEKDPRLGDDQELEIQCRDLVPDMVLARDLFNSSGILLVSKDTTITEGILQHLAAFRENDPFMTGIFVRRSGKNILGKN